ncbi:hypothetical protein NQZ68_028215 [Xyrichtys novacula]|uniref:Chemokine interleukin-8-like domain-containing protein n=1 Tax=Xyrichtys novacula TaxID=13765 RepID=A0AAV1G995_XYRNO|nr:hypothetical protein NQZ68_028215 [Xyrichtys novacula]
MTKPLLLLAALTLCCIASLQAFPRQGCSCRQTLSIPIPLRVIKRIEVIPASGQCRWTEIIVTRRNGSRVCVNPKMEWVNDLLSDVQRKLNSSSSTVSATSVIN